MVLEALFGDQFFESISFTFGQLGFDFRSVLVIEGENNRVICARFGLQNFLNSASKLSF